MTWIVGGSLRFRYLVVAGAVAMMAIGATSMHSMRVDVFPEFAPPRVVIQTACVGLSTSDVEQLVTVPMEQALNGVDGLDEMRSKSVPQLSSIELLFTPDTDLLQARALVQERLATVATSLPTWAAPPVMLAPVSAQGRAMEVGMTSSDQSVIQMSMTAYWDIRARLLQVPGVANVAIWNERLHMMTVHAIPAKMQAHNVSLDEVMTATADTVDSGLLKFSNGSVIGTGGWVESPNQRVGVRNILPIATPADLSKVTITRNENGAVRLGDVARVSVDHQPLIGTAVINGEPGILLVIEKLPWANTLELTQGVDEAIQEMQPGMPGIVFDTQVFQQADFIKLAISNLTQSLLLGFLLVILILGLFLFEWRVVLISLITIPLSLMAAMLVLYLTGATVNTMTLAGLVIALGAVVDDAIIDVENIVRRLRQRRLAGDSSSTASIILDASLEVRSPIVYATLIIIAAVVPVFLLQGLTGAFFRPLALSYTLAIIASMVIALTVTPALTLILLSRAHVERHHSPMVRRLQHGYSLFLMRIIGRPKAAYAAFGAATVLGVLVLPLLGQSLFPAFKERDFLIHWVAVPGTSSQEMERTTTAVSQELLEVEGVRSVGAHLGQALLGEEVAGVNLGEIWVSLDPSVDYDQALTSIEEVTHNYPGLFRETQTYLDERVEEVVSGAKAPIVIRVYGEDLATIRREAALIRSRISEVDGIADIHSDISTDTPQIEVRVRLPQAEKFGLKPGDVRRAAATLVAGEEVGDIFRDGRAYDTVVWSPRSMRSSPGDIENMPIDTPQGAVVRLGDVASVRLAPNPNAIEREGDSRYLDVDASVEGADLGSVVNGINEALEGVTFPRGTHVEVLGEYQERQAAQSRLLATAGLVAVLVLLLLHAALRRWRLALLVFFTLPMALVGGVLAAWAFGGIISLGSLVGFFTVFGIAARNGILLINHCQHLEQSEGETFGPALVVRGARERLAPILMTSLATGLALVPLVVLGERPGHEIEHPVAVVILGGLVTSTLLTLLILPSLYLRFGRPRPELVPAPFTPGGTHEA